VLSHRLVVLLRLSPPSLPLSLPPPLPPSHLHSPLTHSSQSNPNHPHHSKKKKKSHKKKRAREEGDDDDDHPSSSTHPRKEGAEGGEEGEEEAALLQAKQGTGRITSSGQIVTGYETEFLRELRVNDALIITHPSTLIEETRIIKMIVSNGGMSISSGFSTDLISTTKFRYLHPPVTEEGEGGREAREEEGRKREKAGEEDKAFGTYGGGGGTKLVYRVKKGGTYGGYKIVTEDTGAALSRTELLERRLQHKSDRHAN